MKSSKQIFAGLALSAGLLFVLPSIAQAHDGRPHVGINFSFGVPFYEAPSYIYAPPPAYVYVQPRTIHYEYYDQGYYGRGYDRQDDYYGDGEEHRNWHDHHRHHHHDDDDD